VESADEIRDPIRFECASCGYFEEIRSNQEKLRLALQVVTAWSASDEDAGDLSFLQDTLSSLLAEAGDPNDDDTAPDFLLLLDLVGGLTMLCGYFLVALERVESEAAEREVPISEILQRYGLWFTEER
jgi:hypothetical protein